MSENREGIYRQIQKTRILIKYEFQNVGSYEELREEKE